MSTEGDSNTRVVHSPQAPGATPPPRPWFIWLLRNRWFQIYLAVLLLSHLTMSIQGVTRSKAVRSPAGAARLELTLPRMKGDGPVAGTSYRLNIWRWGDLPGHAAPGAPGWETPNVILLHGSPSGGGRDFAVFGPRLAEAGYTVYAPDLPGFGASMQRPPDYSIKANARMVLAAMDDLNIERAHVVGWSLGGGAAIWMAELDPQRIASLTLMGSIGAQETEGSGDYYFEQFKYRAGQLLLVGLPELIPHFGLLGRRQSRGAFIHNFIDSDLRPMGDLMRRLTTPTMIIHGRHDFLVPSWAAEEHHKLIGPSTLVMLDGDHFLPLAAPMAREGQLEQVVDHTLTHLALHDSPGHMVHRGEARFARTAESRAARLGGIQLSRHTAWWVVVLAIILGTFVSEDLTIITVGLLMVSQSLDWGVGLIGCFIAIVVGDLALWGLGRCLGRRVLRWPLIRNVVNEESIDRWGRVLDAHTGKAVLLSRCLPGTRMPTFIAAGILSKKAHHFAMWVGIAAFIWTPILLGMTMLVGPRLLEVFRSVFHGPWAIVAAIVVLYIVIRLIGYETTPQGRDRLKADLKRYISREFWPAWIFYLPLWPWYLWLTLRHRGPMTFSCANPGIPNGGGLVGESKTQILHGFGLGNPQVLSAYLIPEDDDVDRRIQRALELIREGSAVGGFPVVLKPDAGERGAGMRIARSEDDVRDYFRSTDRAIQLQRYHPGPYELGVLWSRVPAAGKPVDDWKGEVFSATSKTFPVIEGDGKRTLETLIWRHPRYRMQARVFLKRFAGQADRVLAEGERLQLTQAGNHCQGARFGDGMREVSPALARRIDELAQAWRDPQTGKRVDFGRFDIRCATQEGLRDGVDFAVVEFNGTSSESTSMYDPDRSFLWAYSLLFRHWSRLFSIGAARRREGARPMTLAALMGALRRHRRRGAPSRISD
jgi:pimeloyl-ACP methyl ester carboxylesterase/membrane protein DedA with SNARE-associated domain